MGTVVILVLGCTETPEPPAPVQVVVEPEPAEPRPIRRTLSLKRAATWDGPTGSCEPPCAAIPVRQYRASSEVAGARAFGAVDGQLGTRWCGERGVRDQLMVQFAETHDVSSMVLHARGIAKIELVTSEWDEATITLDVPPSDEAKPPWVELGFDAVDYLNLEIKALHPYAEPCIEEVAFTGVPAP